MNAVIDYEHGTVLNYSLIAYAPVEGYRIEFEARVAGSSTPTSSGRG
jgi:hypothetical protein